MTGFLVSWASMVPLAACEMLSFCFYARLVSSPKAGPGRRAARSAATTLAYAAVFAAPIPVSDDHSLLFVIAWLVVLWWLFYSTRQLSPRQALYHGLVIILSTHFLRHLFGNALIMSRTGSIWFLHPDLGPRYILGCLSILALFSASLLAMGRFVSREEGGEEGSLPYLAVVAILLVLVNSYAVAALRATYGGEGFSRFLTALSSQELLCWMLGVSAVLGTRLMLRSARERAELDQTRQLMREQMRQYRMQKESLERLAMYRHDLKRHVGELRELLETRGGSASLAELESDIDRMGNVCRTGNDALDVILSDALDRCRRRGIVLQLLVNGTSLAHVGVVDLVAIFDNAIDNAVEAVSKLPVDDREVLLRCGSKRGWTVIRVENSCPSRPVEKDGLPATTKPQGDEPHGLGMANMRRAVERYGGHLSWSWDDGRFAVNMVIPAVGKETESAPSQGPGSQARSGA